MSDATYVSFAGTVQQYGADKPVAERFEVNNTYGWRVNIRTSGSQTPIQLTLWAEYEAFIPHLTKNMFLAGEGKYTENTRDGRTFRNVSVYDLSAVPVVNKAPREVVNAQAAPSTSSTAPSF